MYPVQGKLFLPFCVQRQVLAPPFPLHLWAVFFFFYILVLHWYVLPFMFLYSTLACSVYSIHMFHYPLVPAGAQPSTSTLCCIINTAGVAAASPHSDWWPDRLCSGSRDISGVCSQPPVCLARALHSCISLQLITSWHILCISDPLYCCCFLHPIKPWVRMTSLPQTIREFCARMQCVCVNSVTIRRTV